MHQCGRDANSRRQSLEPKCLRKCEKVGMIQRTAPCHRSRRGVTVPPTGGETETSLEADLQVMFICHSDNTCECFHRWHLIWASGPINFPMLLMIHLAIQRTLFLLVRSVQISYLYPSFNGASRCCSGVIRDPVQH